ncbi:MAG: C40 family peptidase [Nitrospirae bacterium]|nr:C40 family peptidase [Nitrospirota bacterium]
MPPFDNTPDISEKADRIPTTTGEKTDRIPAVGEIADPVETTIGEQAAFTAVSMIGRPYQYKGNSPAGFDCSGLVQYSYQAAGLDVPHGTKALRAITLPIEENMQIGDLLFFNERGKTYSHVGIYLGGDTFVHAPSTGGQVRTESLEDPYWKSSFVEARRFM